MGMRRTNYIREESFPESETAFSNQLDQSFVPKLENIYQLQGSRISAERLSNILDASIAAQKICMKLAIETISPTTCSNSGWKFMNCYLDSTVLLLDACNNIQLRLESIRSCLDSIPVGLHYLEAEHEPSRAVLQRAAAALESSRFIDRRHCNKMEKIMSRMRTFDKKISVHTPTYEETGDSNISPELYKALSGSRAMAALAIGVLGSATSFSSLTNPYVQPPKAEPWAILFNELSKKVKVFPKKTDETASMKELAAVDSAARTLLKLISAWQKGGSSSLRRMAVKALGGELRRRRKELGKTLPLLERKIGELYKQIVALRVSMSGLLSKTRGTQALETLKPSSCETSQMDVNPVQLQGGVTRIRVKKQLTSSSSSLGPCGLNTFVSLRGLPKSCYDHVKWPRNRLLYGSQKSI